MLSAHIRVLCGCILCPLTSCSGDGGKGRIINQLILVRLLIVTYLQMSGPAAVICNIGSLLTAVVDVLIWIHGIVKRSGTVGNRTHKIQFRRVRHIRVITVRSAVMCDTFLCLKCSASDRSKCSRVCKNHIFQIMTSSEGVGCYLIDRGRNSNLCQIVISLEGIGVNNPNLVRSDSCGQCYSLHASFHIAVNKIIT